MNRIKNLIMCTGLAACAAISLAAIAPATAAPETVYYTNFNGLPSGSAGFAQNVGPSNSNWADGAANQNDWSATANATVTGAPGSQLVDLNTTQADSSANILSPTFTSIVGATYTLTVDITNPSLVPETILLESAGTLPAPSTTLAEAFQLPAGGSSVETISWTGTASNFDFTVGALGTAPLDVNSVLLQVEPVPEASTVIGLGVMLALGGLFMVVSRKRTSSNMAF